MRFSKYILLILVSLSFSFKAFSKSVLYLGDSQSAGYLGKIVFEALAEKHGPENVDVFGISSSSPRHWGYPKHSRVGKWLCQQKGRHNKRFEVPLSETLCSGKKTQSALEVLLEQKEYTYVIFQFLGNSTHLPLKQIKANIQKTLKPLAERKCLFITSPPHNYTGMNNKKRKEVEKHFVDSIGSRCEIIRGMIGEEMSMFFNDSSNYLRDRVHLSKKGAQQFFDLKIKSKLP